MRLIDADALFQGVMKRQYFDIQAQETARGGGERSMAYSCAMERIREAPTIDAIPVEWLREHKHWAAVDGDNECVLVIAYLLDRWQKEQEAR